MKKKIGGLFYAKIRLRQDAYAAQQILGHADVSTTLGIYTELRAKQKEKSIKKLDREAKKYLTKNA